MTASVTFFIKDGEYFLILNGKRIHLTFSFNQAKLTVFDWFKCTKKELSAYNGDMLKNPSIRIAIICQVIANNLEWITDPQKTAQQLYENFGKNHKNNKPFTEIIEYE